MQQVFAKLHEGEVVQIDRIDLTKSDANDTRNDFIVCRHQQKPIGDFLTMLIR